jgi:FemAB-related protein (PEP-CTERM system-associated)
MTPVRIAPLDETWRAAWDAFVSTAPQASFFHLSGWKDAIEGTFHHRCPYLMALEGDRILGILPLVHLRSRLFGSALISTAFCVYGGPVTVDGRAEAALDAAARALAQELGVDYLEYRSQAAARRGWAVQSQLYATFRKRLPSDPDALFKQVPRKRRAELRKAFSSNLAVDRDGEANAFYRLYTQNMHRHGTPALPLAWFQALKRSFGGASDCTIVRHGRTPVSAVMTFRFRDAVLPYYAGASDHARALHANDLIYWELMRRTVEGGGGEFDFGRSKAGTGAYAYKRSWGFEPAPLHYEYLLLRRAEMPQFNPLNPKYRLLIGLWKRLPLALANLIGPPIARGLG